MEEGLCFLVRPNNEQLSIYLLWTGTKLVLVQVLTRTSTCSSKSVYTVHVYEYSSIPCTTSNIISTTITSLEYLRVLYILYNFWNTVYLYSSTCYVPVHCTSTCTSTLEYSTRHVLAPLTRTCTTGTLDVVGR
jgi:hypothetical protein